MDEWKKLGVMTATIIAGSVFILLGALKLTGASQQMFVEWGYPAWFSYVIGMVELLAGAVLMWPTAALYAAAVLLAEMVGAAITHIMHGEFLFLLAPISMSVLLVIAGWSWRPNWVRERMHEPAATRGV